MFLLCAIATKLKTFKIRKKLQIIPQRCNAPTGEVKLVEAEIEGRVVDIRVKGNQKVKQGDIIATLDNSTRILWRSRL
jgi:acetyl/propionyl-CoA carboxylase alpha subunit